MDAVRMHLGRQGEEFLFERFAVNPWPARLVEEGKIIRHAISPEVLVRTGSRTETLAAGATRGGVGIFHLESSVLQGIDIIKLAAGHIQRALGVHHHADAAGLDEDVPVRGAVLQIHFVLQAGTAAADHGNAQYALRTTLPREQRADLLRRVRRHLDQALVADSEIRC